jgi:hypothetical protein
MDERIDPGAAPTEAAARTETWLGGLLFRGLCLPEGLTIEHEARERDGARAAAAELAGELEGARLGEASGGAREGAGIAERVLAAQFVSAHAAAMDRQAEANRRDLPDHARATSQRLARQLMALTTSQIHALCRLKAERRKEREQAARLAEREIAAKAQARAAETRAMIAGFEQTLKDLAPSERETREGAFDTEFDIGFEEDFVDAFEHGVAETAGFAGAARRAKPEPVGAGVPEPPDPSDAAGPPLNRRQRRALARLRRKEKRGEGGCGKGRT